jgi:hypothetical protein
MKKNFLKTFVALMALGLVFASCSKDDSEEPGVGSVTYKGETYSMTRGFIDYAPSVTRGNLYDLECTIHSAGLNLDKLSGTGNSISFNFWSTSSAEITPGTYTIGSNSRVLDNVISGASLLIGINLNEFSVDTEVDITSGTVVVAKTGSTYTFTINCKNSSNEAITGTYKGTLDYNIVEEEEFKK